MINTIYLIKTEGLAILKGKDGDEIKEKIENSGRDSRAFKFYDEDSRKWVDVAMQTEKGDIEPLRFLEADDYGTTSSELYSKAVTYSNILAQCIEIINRKLPSFWERIMKPTTIVTAIVAVVFVMIIIAVAMLG